LCRLPLRGELGLSAAFSFRVWSAILRDVVIGFALARSGVDGSPQLIAAMFLWDLLAILAFIRI